MHTLRYVRRVMHTLRYTTEVYPTLRYTTEVYPTLRYVHNAGIPRVVCAQRWVYLGWYESRKEGIPRVV